LVEASDQRTWSALAPERTALLVVDMVNRQVAGAGALLA
jgi:hypothetical protein